VRNVHAVGKRLIRPGERFGWKTEVTRFFEAMRPERTCLHAVRTVILNALLKSVELEVQF